MIRKGGIVIINKGMVYASGFQTLSFQVSTPPLRIIVNIRTSPKNSPAGRFSVTIRVFQFEKRWFTLKCFKGDGVVFRGGVASPRIPL